MQGPYSSRIKTLEESYRQIELQINTIQNSTNPDKEKLASLFETKSKYFNELRDYRRAEYEYNQTVHFDDDR